MLNQLRLKRLGDHGRLVIAKVGGKVRIRTYTFHQRYSGSRVGFMRVVLEGALVVERGWTWSAHDAWDWLEARTGGISID